MSDETDLIQISQSAKSSSVWWRWRLLTETDEVNWFLVTAEGSHCFNLRSVSNGSRGHSESRWETTAQENGEFIEKIPTRSRPVLRQRFLDARNISIGFDGNCEVSTWI